MAKGGIWYSADLTKFPVTIGTPVTTTLKPAEFKSAVNQADSATVAIAVGTVSSAVTHILPASIVKGSSPKLLAVEVANTSAAAHSIFEVATVSNAVKILSRTK